MEKEERDKLVRVRHQTHLELMKIKDSEGFANAGSVIQSLLESRGGIRVTVTVGTCQVWARTV